MAISLYGPGSMFGGTYPGATATPVGPNNPTVNTNVNSATINQLLSSGKPMSQVAQQLGQAGVTLDQIAAATGQSPQAIQQMAQQGGINFGQGGAIQLGGIGVGQSQQQLAQGMGGNIVNTNPAGQTPMWQYQGPGGDSTIMDINRMGMTPSDPNKWMGGMFGTASNDQSALNAGGVSTAASVDGNGASANINTTQNNMFANAGYTGGGQALPGTVPNQYLNQMGAMMTPGNQFTSTDPSYQWRYQQGLEAMQRQLAQGGLNYSGNALTAAQQYGQGMASQEYQNQFNRLGTAAGLAYTGTGQAQQYQEAQQQFNLSQKAVENQQSTYQNSLQSAGLASLWNGISGGQGLSGALGNIGNIGSTVANWFSGSGTNLDQYNQLLSQQDGLNFSNIAGVIGGSQQDMQLADQVSGIFGG